MSLIKNQLETAFDELILQSNPEEGDILVVGCSSSEVLGEKIGTSGSLETATEIFSVLKEKCKEKGLFLACQCCEHLNRALVVEKELAKRERLTIVNAVPHEKAGGSFATAAYRGFNNPVLVEEITAQLGIDIGSTLMGMHLSRVAVPVRTSIKKIGEAPVTFARVRPKYIGGERAKYN
ncbi:MAG: TIGR01440 family protein [Clostridia bacterium]|nr:TIGR01440 family protein [Clostridia bacterium]